MKNVLIAWELGEAFGHLARCLQLAHALLQRNCRVTLVLKDIRLPAGYQPPAGLSVIQTPQALGSLQPRRGPQSTPINHAALLQRCGFADPHGLADRLRVWQTIIRLVNPDRVVADHAPTALLASRLAGIPGVSIGNGFVIPPDQDPWPSIRPWSGITLEALRQVETELNTVTDGALAILSGSSSAGNGNWPRMRDLYGSKAVLDTFAELDHYGARPGVVYAGPIVSVPQARSITWQDRVGAKVLAYLRPETPGFHHILSGLSQVDAEVLCVSPGLDVQWAKRYASKRLRVSLAPVDLTPLLQEAHLAVGYGSCGFATQALMAGVPLLMRPKHVEQALVVRQVEAMGAGKALDLHPPNPVGAQDAGTTIKTVVERVDQMLADAKARAAAQAFEQRYRGFKVEHAIAETLDAIGASDSIGAATLPPSEHL